MRLDFTELSWKKEAKLDNHPRRVMLNELMAKLIHDVSLLLCSVSNTGGTRI